MRAVTLVSQARPNPARIAMLGLVGLACETTVQDDLTLWYHSTCVNTPKKHALGKFGCVQLAVII